MITQEELRKIILKDLALDSLSAEVQEKILTKLGENIIKRIALAVLENIPENARSEFDNLSQAANPEKMREFLKTWIPNFEELTQNTIKKTVEEFKALAKIK